jgi:hypothetical protein
MVLMTGWAVLQNKKKKEGSRIVGEADRCHHFSAAAAPQLAAGRADAPGASQPTLCM